MDLENKLKKYLQKNIPDIIFRDNKNYDLWYEVVNNTDYLRIDYTGSLIDYRCEYFKDIFKLVNLSTIFIENKKPIAIWPLTLITEKKKKKLSNFHINLLRPKLIKNLSKKRKKSVFTKSYHILKTLGKKLKIRIIDLKISTLENNVDDILWFNQHFLPNNKSKIKKTEIYLDLSNSFEDIRSNFRTRYKPLINSNLSKFSCGILEDENISIWDEFKKLHYKNAKRITRSCKSWDLQRLSLKKKEGFLVYLKKEEKYVGFGYFNFSKDECKYSVGAYDASEIEKFKSPLGHLIQYYAIKFMKKEKIKWYKLGDEDFELKYSKNNSKINNINHFLKGFCSHEFPVITYSIKT